MKWAKHGHIYKPDGSMDWSQSHAQVPVVDILNKDVWRIFFATRDKENRSRTGYIDVVAGQPDKVLNVSQTPVLDLGKPGTFDDCGAMPSWVLDHNGQKYLYYIGWTVRNTVPYHNSIGLAISEDGGQTYNKFSEGPLFSPTYKEPYFTGTSCVIKDRGKWKNWYLSCTGWINYQGRYEPVYNLKYAESENGIDWQRNGDVAINFKDADEGGLVKASVILESGIYKMWYAYRKAKDYRHNKENSYRIGYAESKNGIDWQRRDEDAGINISATGWDSEMVTYPHIIKHKGQKFMFYNGNGFGQSGIGYAVMKEGT